MPVTVGVHGVQLKRFEQVVATLLTQVTPRYSQLPSPPYRIPEWTAASGQSADPVRAKRKQDQTKSMMRCILSLLPEHVLSLESTTTTTYTIVDFGGGSGHLAIPLALTLPNCRVICVDLSAQALNLLHQKASDYCCQDSPAIVTELKYQSTCIPNLFTFHGPVQAFDLEYFDMAVALHLCGEATDVVLRIAGKKQASAVVVSPCCVGKLAANGDNPYVFQATGKNIATVSYPQSTTFCQLILGTMAVNKYKKDLKASERMEQKNKDKSDWDALAKSADYSSMPETRTPRNAARRTAKALLETDRSLFLQETFAYETCLTRMDPWEASPKNDILLAWRRADTYPLYHPANMPPDVSSEQDIRQTMDHLLHQNEKSKEQRDSVDWTKEEENEIRKRIEDFFGSKSNDDSKDILVFPTRMGGRRRKLIHFVAEQMQLAHWSHGKKEAEKTVAVSRTRRTII